jgi:hypothetical protein
MTPPTVCLARPSFWPEPRAPEAWLRALAELDRLMSQAKPPALAGPWPTWQRHLSRLLSRRSVPGLFGLEMEGSHPRLWGVGFLRIPTCEAGWVIAGEAGDVLGPWRKHRTADALRALALHLLGRSVWLRLLLVRLASGRWQLRGWDRLRQGNDRLRVGAHLVFPDGERPEDWLAGVEADCLGPWQAPLAEACGQPDFRLAAPHAAEQSEEFSWSPLQAPLYLLDSLGWLSLDGRLRLPDDLAGEPHLAALLPPGDAPARWLREATTALADVRGFAPVEGVLRALAGRAGGPDPADAARFRDWADALLGQAVDAGAIEVQAAEPGQARHGRGLLGDRQRRLVRWHVHDDFSAVFARVSGTAVTFNGDTRHDRATEKG